MPNPETPRPSVDLEPSMEEQFEKEREHNRLLTSWLEHDVKNGLTVMSSHSAMLREHIAHLAKQVATPDTVKAGLAELKQATYLSEVRADMLQVERELYVFGLAGDRDRLVTKQKCNPDIAVTDALRGLSERMGAYKFLLVGRDAQGNNHVLQSPSFQKIYGDVSGSPYSVDSKLAPAALNVTSVETSDKIVPKLQVGAFEPTLAARILMEKLGTLVGQSESSELEDGKKIVPLGIECDGSSISVSAQCSDPNEAIQSLQYRLGRVWQKVLDNLGITQPFTVTETTDWPPFNVRLRMNLLPDAAPTGDK